MGIINLLVQQLEPVVGFGLSYTVGQRIKKYYDMFKEANDYKNKGDLTSFVIGFLEIVKESIENLCSTIEARADKFNFDKEKIEKYADENKPLGTVMYALVQNSLFADEGISIYNIAENAKLSSSVSHKLRNGFWASP